MTNSLPVVPIDREELRRIVTAMTAIPSPSGDEAVLARYLADELRACGVPSRLQHLSERQANAFGRLAGDGSGPELLLYAPIDMHIAGDAGIDRWIDYGGRDDLIPRPRTEGDFVIGLGAENPKGHAACVLAAAGAIARAGIPLRGALVAGFGAGGMPVNRSPHPAVMQADVAHGSGCAFMLAHGVSPDYAVIAKPGESVAYEEVGLCWFEIVVRGDYSYAGIGPRPGKRNAIVDAAVVVAELDAWFAQYTERNTSGCVAPKASISAVEGGWPEKPAFTPSRCVISLDLRISPRTTLDDASAQLDAALERIRERHPGITIERRLLVAIPGTSTPADNWIVDASIAAWERAHGRAHDVATGTSGATDANILRAHGVPTARIGMPRLGPDAPFAGRFSMGVVSLDAMVTLTRSLIDVALTTVTRTRGELGLD